MKPEQDKTFILDIDKEQKRRLQIKLLRIKMEEDAVLAAITSKSDNTRTDELRYDNDEGNTVLRVELGNSLRGWVGVLRASRARRRTFFLYDMERTDARLVVPSALSGARIEVARLEQAGRRGEQYAVVGSQWDTYANENLNPTAFKLGIDHFRRLHKESKMRES